MNGNRLKELRKAKGLTQAELGNILGVTKASICCYEKETRTPPVESIINMMALYNVSIDYLIGADNIVTIEDKDIKRNEVISNEEFEFIKELRKNKFLAEILLEDPKRSIELIDKKIG